MKLDSKVLFLMAYEHDPSPKGIPMVMIEGGNKGRRTHTLRNQNTRRRNVTPSHSHNRGVQYKWIVRLGQYQQSAQPLRTTKSKALQTAECRST